MSRFLTAALIIAVCFSFTAPHSSYAEKADSVSSGLSYGVVVKPGGDTIILEETAYDDSRRENVIEETVYHVLPYMDVDNADGTSELSAGDSVNIEYVIMDGRRHARYVYVFDTAGDGS